MSFPERCPFFTKIEQGERNYKKGKRSFTCLGIAEPQPIFYKNRANERKENLFSVSRVQPIFYKDS